MGSDVPLLSDQNESNSWAIHGNYTKSGLPLLASDPHLKNAAPCDWVLTELKWKDQYVSGASIAGCPGIQVGRNKDIAWGCTTPRVDNTDIWEEDVNDDFTQYRVDGEWREITKRMEVIPVRGQESIEFEIGFTHRGPIIESNLLKGGAENVFMKGSAKTERSPYYSFGWAGGDNVPGEDSWKVMDLLYNSDSVPELFK